MLKCSNFFFLLVFLYSCSPINKQHGYLMDDLLISVEKISEFELLTTTKQDIFNAMGSPSIEINDVDHVWIYLISVKEKKVFDEDSLLFQNIFRFVFDEDKLVDTTVLEAEDFNKITFSPDKTKVRRDAYGITDQLYDAFTRGQ